jgi:glycosyltransferase involved in cell wall biosynthesis
MEKHTTVLKAKYYMREFNPLVSIVIPVYNGSIFLREAIDSALAQTYQNLEIVVVNDGSKDDTESIALSYGDKIRYFAKKNGGTSTALNLGIENMRGEYFSWLSHDDLYYPQKIARSVEALSNMENKDTIIISDVDGMNEDYTRTFQTAWYQAHRDAYPKRNSSYLYPVVYNKTHGCTHLVSKKVFETVGLFDEKLLVAHDFEFYYRAFAKFPHLYIDEVLVTARESATRQGRRCHTRANVEYSLVYIDILEHLSLDEILQMAPTLKTFFLDMESFFSDADYSIALDYLEVMAEREGIQTKYGRRELTFVSDADSSIALDYLRKLGGSRYNIPVRLVRAIKRYGLSEFFRRVFIRLEARRKARHRMKKMLSYILHFVRWIGKTVLTRNTYEKMHSWLYRVFILRSKKVKVPKFAKLQHGVNLFVTYENGSAGVEAHLLKLALEAALVPYNIIDLNAPDKFPSDMKGKALYNTNLVCFHAASGIPARMLSFGINLKKHYNIGYWAWELAEVPDVYCECLDMFQEFWTLSAFCTNVLGKKTSVPVLTVPLYANLDRSAIKNGRKYYNINKDVFLFTVAYDCNSFVSRKNPQAAVQAFMKAFSPQDSNVGLLLKLSNFEKHKDHFEELQKILEPYPNIYYICKYLSNDEMRTLIQVSDTYVSLHRSEGFGLVPMEAMALGTPVISTAWSGNMEYMNHMNTALVGYTLVPVAGQYVGSTPGDGLVWADPDVNEAAAHMRRMVADKEWREKLITNGKYTANECYNVTTISRAMRKRLEFLKLIEQKK